MEALVKDASTNQEHTALTFFFLFGIKALELRMANVFRQLSSSQFLKEVKQEWMTGHVV